MVIVKHESVLETSFSKMHDLYGLSLGVEIYDLYGLSLGVVAKKKEAEIYGDIMDCGSNLSSKVNISTDAMVIVDDVEQDEDVLMQIIGEGDDDHFDDYDDNDVDVDGGIVQCATDVDVFEDIDEDDYLNGDDLFNPYFSDFAGENDSTVVELLYNDKDDDDELDENYGQDFMMRV